MRARSRVCNLLPIIYYMTTSQSPSEVMIVRNFFVIRSKNARRLDAASKPMIMSSYNRGSISVL